MERERDTGASHTPSSPKSKGTPGSSKKKTPSKEPIKEELNDGFLFFHYTDRVGGSSATPSAVALCHAFTKEKIRKEMRRTKNLDRSVIVPYLCSLANQADTNNSKVYVVREVLTPDNIETVLNRIVFDKYANRKKKLYASVAAIVLVGQAKDGTSQTGRRIKICYVPHQYAA